MSCCLIYAGQQQIKDNYLFEDLDKVIGDDNDHIQTYVVKTNNTIQS